VKTIEEVRVVLHAHKLYPSQDYLDGDERITSLQVEEDDLKAILSEIGPGWITRSYQLLDHTGYVQVDLVRYP